MFGFRHRRHGFSLLELMLVLAIMVAVTMIAWPRLSGRMENNALQEAALQLKEDLAEIREQAIVSGEPWLCRVRRGSIDYQLGPVSAFQFDLDSASTGDRIARSRESKNTDPIENQRPLPDIHLASEIIDPRSLPPGILFEGASPESAYEIITPRDAAVGLGNAMAMNSLPVNAPLGNPLANHARSLGPSTTGEEGPSDVLKTELALLASQPIWNYAVVFQPDGRASDSEVILLDDATGNKIRLRIRGFVGCVTLDAVERPQIPVFDAEVELSAQAFEPLPPVAGSIEPR